MCPKALLPVLVQINAIWEMAPEWANSGRETPPDIIFRPDWKLILMTKE